MDCNTNLFKTKKQYFFRCRTVRKKTCLINISILVLLLACLAYASAAPCTEIDSTIINSTAESVAGECTILNSTIIDSYIEDSTISYSSINSSVILDSTITNASFTSSNHTHSTISFSQPCTYSRGYYALISNNIFYFGSFSYGGYTYFLPKNLSKICEGSAPAVGALSMNKTIVKEGDSIKISYTGSVGSTVLLNSSSLNLSLPPIPLSDINGDSIYDGVLQIGSEPQELDAAQETGIVGLWHFNNDSVYGENSTSIHDFSGNGNNGTCSGTMCPLFDSTAGKMNGAFMFDGINDYFIIPKPVSTSHLGTVELWTKSRSNQPFMMAVSSGYDDPFSGNTNNIIFYLRLNSPAIMGNNFVNSSIIQSNVWNHLAFISTGSRYEIWVNGINQTLSVESGSNDGDWFGDEALIANTVIGSVLSWIVPYPFNGTIDEVAIYDRVLSPQEIYYHSHARDGQRTLVATVNDNLGNTFYQYLNITLDNTPPFGSINILPENITYSGIVNLLLNYSDANGIDSCAYKNDDGDFTNILFEPCTQTKQWMLSQGYGNKTVFFAAKDIAGNIKTVNSTIEYAQPEWDNTPPTINYVYDGLEAEDSDYFGSNTTLSAHWSATDYESKYIYYEYRILENGTNVTGYIDAGAKTQVVINDLALHSGVNYSIEVQARNPWNLSSTMHSDGATLDSGDPDITMLTSATHPNESITYAETTASFEWGAQDDTGIDGYSYVLDSNPTTIPDSIIESEGNESTREIDPGESGIVGLWHFNNNSTFGDEGTNAYDYSGHNNNGTIFGSPTWDPTGKFRGTYDFDGIDDYVSLGDRDLVSGKKMAVSAWIKTSAQNDEYVTIVGKNRDTWSWSLQFDNIPNKIRFFVSADSYADKAVSDSVINDGQWHHLAGVYDGTLIQDNILLYVDGILQASTSAQTIDVPNTVDYETIGAYASDAGVNGYFNGSIDEVAVYNQTLSAGQVLAHYRNGVPGSNNATFSNLASGTYYFHLKAIDDAGNFAVAHKKITILSNTSRIALLQGKTETEQDTINVSGNVSINSDIMFYVNDAYQTNITAEGLFTAEITLNNGTNYIHAVAHANNLTSTSNTIKITKLINQYANLSFTLSFSSAGTSLSRMAYYDSGDYVFGLASEAPNSNPSSNPALLVSTNSTTPALIFLSTQNADLRTRNNELERNGFLDSQSPTFRPKSSENFVGLILLPDSWLFIENSSAGQGRYELVLENMGKENGKAKVKAEIR